MRLRWRCTPASKGNADLDFVVAGRITDGGFLDKKYRIDPPTGKRFTSRGYRIDVYWDRELNGISLDHIRKTVADVVVDKRRGVTVRAISLEGLIVSKFRAGRDSDIEDLWRLAARCGPRIVWDRIRGLSSDGVEHARIRDAFDLYLARLG